MPSQLQCPTRAPRSFTIAMKLPSVMKRWLQVSHLQPSRTYAQSERSRNPRRFRPPSRLSLQSSASKAWMFARADPFRKAPSGGRSSGFNGSRASPETTGHRAFKHMTPWLSAPLPGNVFLILLTDSSVFFSPLFFPRQRWWTSWTNVSTWIFTRLEPASSYHSPGRNHLKCSYRRVTKSSPLLFKENKFHKQPQGQKHSPEEYEISNSLR